MAIEDVQELVTKLQEVQAQIRVKQSELEKLRKGHLDFWAQFQEECRKTGHSLTEKEKDALSNPDKYYTGKLTSFEFHMMTLRTHGYRCAYCLKRVPGRVEDWSLKLDLSKRECFDNWIGNQADKWPTEKVSVLKKARKEVENYFAKAEALEQAIEALKKEEEAIRAPLEATWKLLDDSLGKSQQRKQSERKLRDRYEQRIRDIEYANRPSPPFGDPDAFWD